MFERWEEIFCLNLVVTSNVVLCNGLTIIYYKGRLIYIRFYFQQSLYLKSQLV